MAVPRADLRQGTVSTHAFGAVIQRVGRDTDDNPTTNLLSAHLNLSLHPTR